MDPVVPFFALGLLARLAKSDLRLPPAIYEALSLYLLLAIGLKGGVELTEHPIGVLAPKAVAIVGLGLVLPLLAYPVLRGLRLRRADAASVAAHYGSVSVVTFAVASTFLGRKGIEAESYAPLFIALLEAPGILSGVFLARRGVSKEAGPGAPGLAWGALAQEVFFGKSILLLVGGLLVGAMVGAEGFEPLRVVFVDAFKGLLALFLLELGVVTGARLEDLRRAGPAVLLFGVLTPPVFGFFGAALGTVLGLGVGGTVLLATLAGSASYIAAPTAMRIAVPEASPALSIGLSLGVTFPFNITVGIPLYLSYARFLEGLGA
jgi:hypothetical protein